MLKMKRQAARISMNAKSRQLQSKTFACIMKGHNVLTLWVPTIVQVWFQNFTTADNYVKKPCFRLQSGL